MHAISSYRGNRPTHTNKQSHKPTDRTDYNVTAYQRKITINLLFYYKRTTQKKTIIEHTIQNETRRRKTKLVNLNTTQDQPRNYPLARPGQKGRALERAAPRGLPEHARDT